MTHSLWINTNYKFLEKWSKAWAKEGWSDLLSMYIEYIDKNWQKFAFIPDGDDRLRFTQTWLKNMTKWSNSEYNRLHSVNNLAENWHIPDECEDSYLEVLAESHRDDIKLWLKDLFASYSEKDATRLVKLREIYLKLELHERVLWDLYFTQMLSLRDIGKKIDLPHMAVYVMIKDLKIKIRKWTGE